jgi:hypothetical protein
MKTLCQMHIETNADPQHRKNAVYLLRYAERKNNKRQETLVIAENRIADPDGWSDNVEGLKNPHSATMFGQAMFRPSVKIIFLQSWGSVIFAVSKTV